MCGYRRERADSRGQPYPPSEAPSVISNTSPTRNRRDSHERPLVLQSRDRGSGPRLRDAEYDDFPQERREVEIARSNSSYTTNNSRRRSTRYSNTRPGSRRMSDSPRTSRYSDQVGRGVFSDEASRGTDRHFGEPERRRGTDHDITSSPTSLAGGAGRWEQLESERGTVDGDLRDEPEWSRRDTASQTIRGYSSDQQGSSSFRMMGSSRFSMNLVHDAAQNLIGLGEEVRIKRDASNGDFIVSRDRQSTLNEAQLWQECLRRESMDRPEAPRNRTGSGPYLADDRHEPRDPPRSSNFTDRQQVGIPDNYRSNTESVRNRPSYSIEDEEVRRRFDRASSVTSSYPDSDSRGFSSRSSHTTAASSAQDMEYRSSGQRQSSMHSNMGQGASVFPLRRERVRSTSYAEPSMQQRQPRFQAPSGTGRFQSGDDDESDPEWGNTPLLQKPRGGYR